MFSQSNDLDDEFGRPVESIMRCEDFKSNFARRLSTRYSSRSPVTSTKQDNVLKFRPSAAKQETLNNGPAIVEQSPKLPRSDSLERNGESMITPNIAVKNDADIRHTEVNALNIEVETLRWQLSQTETNRQMHIALLQQIVTFLNRVKDHIESQKTDAEIQLDTTPIDLPKSLNMTDLPRTRSVFHVSRNVDYTLSPTKKISTRKFSKSISNVNGSKDCNNFWTPSKLCLVSEDETTQKLTEEMSRLITLANTVLSTKLPDLACSCSSARADSSLPYTKPIKNDQSNVQIISKSLDSIEENVTDTIAMDTNCNNETYNGITNELEDVKTRILSDFIVSQSPISSGLENEFAGLKLFDQEHPSSDNAFIASCGDVQKLDKINEYGVSSNFIEDESGFSSMSSFQEIGIPIISIIPPSPCKEVEYFKEISEASEKWNSDAIELDKQSVKVFWV
ncbi:uncharacterized protein LOC112042892 isoform X2 [Bicyclus anynana]|uniref:Uncharacterized protein LOC112042892 isoform X2 n=1 Tax=Bicyclus anynana TaxID=110368 RepID=A0A6J1MHM8_BICAN|nr:uncharacterized protein LOC112042892 isoform X2 [Bicyclus anynana]